MLPGVIPVTALGIGSSTCKIHQNDTLRGTWCLRQYPWATHPGAHKQKWWKIAPRGALSTRGAVFPQKKRKTGEYRLAGVGIFLVGAPTGHNQKHPTLRHFGVTHRQTCDRVIRMFVGKGIEPLLDFKLMESFECEKRKNNDDSNDCNTTLL